MLLVCHKFLYSAFNLQNLRRFAVTGRHSKNVANKKNKLDAAKTRTYNRLAIKILMAVKAGGNNPDSNVELARALKEAHSMKLPKENIERALKKASDKDSASFETGEYEIFGHGGVSIVVVTVTDNSNRANLTIRTYAKKAELKMASPGSILFKFNKKGAIFPQLAFDKDAAIEAALNAQVDDIDFASASTLSDDGDTAVTVPDVILTDSQSLAALQDALIANNITGTSRHIYIPQEFVSVKQDVFELNKQVVEDLRELEGVDDVFHSMAPVALS